jgi:hypothetical protein
MDPAAMLAGNTHYLIFRFGPDHKVAICSGIPAAKLSIFFLSHDHPHLSSRIIRIFLFATALS